MIGDANDISGLVKRVAECRKLIGEGWHSVELPKIDIHKCVHDSIYADEFIEEGDQMLQWCEENAPGNYLYVNRQLWLFKNKAHAVLFKLTWGGK